MPRWDSIFFNAKFSDWRDYWENRLRDKPNLIGTGHRAFSEKYNEAMYAVATSNLQRVMAKAGLTVQGARMLDVGPGLGYFIQKFNEWGAHHITGLDITEYSVQNLRRRFPQHTFVRADASDPTPEIHGQFDVVSAISVLFHIVDDVRFAAAVNNLCAWVKPGGHLILADAFYRPLVVNASHVNMRPLDQYQPIFYRHGCQVVAVQAMYHFFSQSVLPVIGPAILNLPPIIGLMVSGEHWMAEHAPDRKGFLQFLIAQKAA